jgi:histone acetyltransferase 1
MYGCSDGSITVSCENDSKSFNPKFTHTIFREDETIHGYENLSIEIDFLSGSLYPYVSYIYTSKSSDADRLEDYFDASLLPSYKNKRDLPQDWNDNFKPPGKLVGNYTFNDQ